MEQQNKENIQNIVDTANPVVQPTKQNSPLIVILSALLLFSVSVAGFFAYQTQRLVKELRVMSEELKQTPIPEPTSTPDPTANWKTYLNSGALYQVKYPNTWRIVESATMVGFGPQEVGEDVKWTINTYKKNEFTQDKIKEDTGKQFSDRKQASKIININGVEATQVVTVTETAPTWYSEIIIIPYGSSNIVISNGAIKDSAFEDFYSTFSFQN